MNHSRFKILIGIYVSFLEYNLYIFPLFSFYIMSLLNITNLNLILSQKEIFKDLNIQVENGDRVGLIGPNGSGKTTLLRIITHEMRPDSGEVIITSGSRLGYLSQDEIGRASCRERVCT